MGARSELQELYNLIIEDSTNICQSKLLYNNLLSVNNGLGADIHNYIKNNPMILIMNIDERHVVYDYVFDYVIMGKGHPIYQKKWYEFLINISSLLTGLGEKGEMIKADKRYVLLLQHNSINYNKLFETFIDNYYEVGDFEFLLYSVIARGELTKLKKLFNTYDNIEEYMGLFDVALRFGRIEVIKYLLNDIELYGKIKKYGRIMEFNNYEYNQRYMYYEQTIGKNFENYGEINESVQDYDKSISTIMSIYQYDIDMKTLDIWCNIAREKTKHTYKWDNIPNVTIYKIKNYIYNSIPLNHDFGEFNRIIFGDDWSKRSYIVAQYIALQSKYSQLQERCDIIEYRYRKLSDCNNVM
uniref:Uncharacterized protein n=1 Tax=viral metagenome TaxID=1070528 RepID=A0A6C0J5F0_9ZZZZ